MWIEALSWEGLGHLADALGVVTAVPFLVTSAYFVSRARRYRRRLRQLEGVTSGRPVALAVSLAGTRIRPAVEAFCAGFGHPVKLVELHRPGGLTQDESASSRFPELNLGGWHVPVQQVATSAVNGGAEGRGAW